MSETHRDTIDGLLRSKTYYLGAKSDEIADYSENFRADGITVSTVSVFFYGVTKVRAVAAGIDDALSMSETHRDTIDGLLRSKTYYLGAKSDEIADYTHNFKLGTTTIKTTSFYLYTGRRASDITVTSEDAMSTSETYKGEISTVDPLKLMSRTFYVGEKGEEIADYTHNFKLGTTTIKTTSFYLYTGRRASDITVTSEDAMTTSETYKGEIAVVEPLKLMSRTFYVGEKGEEIADYTHNFKLGTTTIKTTSFYLYTGRRASDITVTSEDAMTTSETYKGSHTDVDAASLMSKTYYVGGKGEEIANYTHNYKLGTTTVKTTSIYFYNNARASTADTETAMNKSETYKGSHTDVAPASLMSKTYYVGDKGDEIANYTHNYKFGTTTVSNASIYFYNGLRANNVSVDSETAMDRSETYKGSHTNPDFSSLMSKTYYDTRFGKGDEIANYTHNYKLGTSMVKNTSIYFYNGLRAGTADTDDAMDRSETYRGSHTGPDASNLMNKTFYVGEKGEEIANYTLQYNTGTTFVRSTSVNFYKLNGGTGSLVRATGGSIDSYDPLRVTVAYRGDVSGSVGSITGPEYNIASLNRQSVTFFTGSRGDELADYSVQYKTGAPSVASISVNNYDANDNLTIVDSISYDRHATTSAVSPILPSGITTPTGIIGEITGSSRTEYQYSAGTLTGTITHANTIDKYTHVGTGTSITTTSVNDYEETVSSVTDSLLYDKHIVAGTTSVSVYSGLIAPPDGPGNFGKLIGSSRTENTYDSNGKLTQSETTANSFDKWTDIGIGYSYTVTTYNEFDETNSSKTESISYNRHTDRYVGDETVVPLDPGLVAPSAGKFGKMLGVSYTENTYDARGYITQTVTTSHSFDKWTGTGIGESYSKVTYDAKEEIATSETNSVSYDRHIAVGVATPLSTIIGITGGIALPVDPQFGKVIGTSYTTNTYTAGMIQTTETTSHSFDKWNGAGIGESYSKITYNADEEIATSETEAISYDRHTVIGVSVPATTITAITGAFTLPSDPPGGAYGKLSGISYTKNTYAGGAMQMTETISHSIDKRSGIGTGESYSKMTYDTNEEILTSEAETISYDRRATGLVTPVSTVTDIAGGIALADALPVGFEFGLKTGVSYSQNTYVDGAITAATAWSSGFDKYTGIKTSDTITLTEYDANEDIKETGGTKAYSVSYNKTLPAALEGNAGVFGGLVTSDAVAFPEIKFHYPPAPQDATFWNHYGTGYSGDPLNPAADLIPLGISGTSTTVTDYLQGDQTLATTDSTSYLSSGYRSGESHQTMNFDIITGDPTESRSSNTSYRKDQLITSLSLAITTYGDGEALYTKVRNGKNFDPDDASATTTFNSDLYYVTAADIDAGYLDGAIGEAMMGYSIEKRDSDATTATEVKSTYKDGKILRSESQGGQEGKSMVTSITNYVDGEIVTVSTSTSSPSPGGSSTTVATYGTSANTPDLADRYKWGTMISSATNGDDGIGGVYSTSVSMVDWLGRPLYGTTTGTDADGSTYTEQTYYYDGITFTVTKAWTPPAPDPTATTNGRPRFSYKETVISGGGESKSWTQYYDETDGPLLNGKPKQIDSIGCRADEGGNLADFRSIATPSLTRTFSWEYVPGGGFGVWNNSQQAMTGELDVYTNNFKYTGMSDTRKPGGGSDYEKTITYGIDGDPNKMQIEWNVAGAGNNRGTMHQIWKYASGVLYEIVDDDIGVIRMSYDDYGVGMVGNNFSVSAPYDDVLGSPFNLATQNNYVNIVNTKMNEMDTNKTAVFMQYIGGISSYYNVFEPARAAYNTALEKSDIDYQKQIAAGLVQLAADKNAAEKEYYGKAISAYVTQIDANYSRFTGNTGTGAEESIYKYYVTDGNSLTTPAISGALTSYKTYLNTTLTSVTDAKSAAQTNKANALAALNNDWTNITTNWNTSKAALQGAINSLKADLANPLIDVTYNGTSLAALEGTIASIDGELTAGAQAGYVASITTAWDNLIAQYDTIKTSLETLKTEIDTAQAELATALSNYTAEIAAIVATFNSTVAGKSVNGELAMSVGGGVLYYEKLYESPYGHSGAGQANAGIWAEAMKLRNSNTHTAINTVIDKIKAAYGKLNAVNMPDVQAAYGAAVTHIQGAYETARIAKTRIQSYANKMTDLASQVGVDIDKGITDVWDRKEAEYTRDMAILYAKHTGALAVGVETVDGGAEGVVYTGKKNDLDNAWSDTQDALNLAKADLGQISADTDPFTTSVLEAAAGAASSAGSGIASSVIGNISGAYTPAAADISNAILTETANRFHSAAESDLIGSSKDVAKVAIAAEKDQKIYQAKKDYYDGYVGILDGLYDEAAGLFDGATEHYVYHYDMTDDNPAFGGRSTQDDDKTETISDVSVTRLGWRYLHVSAMSTQTGTYSYKAWNKSGTLVFDNSGNVDSTPTAVTLDYTFFGDNETGALLAGYGTYYLGDINSIFRLGYRDPNYLAYGDGDELVAYVTGVDPNWDEYYGTIPDVDYSYHGADYGVSSSSWQMEHITYSLTAGVAPAWAGLYFDAVMSLNPLNSTYRTTVGGTYTPMKNDLVSGALIVYNWWFENPEYEIYDPPLTLGTNWYSVDQDTANRVTYAGTVNSDYFADTHSLYVATYTPKYQFSGGYQYDPGTDNVLTDGYDPTAPLIAYGEGAAATKAIAISVAGHTYDGDRWISSDTNFNLYKDGSEVFNAANDDLAVSKWDAATQTVISFKNGTYEEGKDETAARAKDIAIHTAKVAYASIIDSYRSALAAADSATAAMVLQYINNVETDYLAAEGEVVAQARKMADPTGFNSAWGRLGGDRIQADLALSEAVAEARTAFLGTLNYIAGPMTGSVYQSIDEFIIAWLGETPAPEVDIYQVLRTALPPVLQDALDWYNSRINQALDFWNDAMDKIDVAQSALLDQINSRISGAYSWLTGQLASLKAASLGIMQSYLGMYLDFHQVITGETVPDRATYLNNAFDFSFDTQSFGSGYKALYQFTGPAQYTDQTVPFDPIVRDAMLWSGTWHELTTLPYDTMGYTSSLLDYERRQLNTIYLPTFVPGVNKGELGKVDYMAIYGSPIAGLTDTELDTVVGWAAGSYTNISNILNGSGYIPLRGIIALYYDQLIAGGGVNFNNEMAAMAALWNGAKNPNVSMKKFLGLIQTFSSQRENLHYAADRFGTAQGLRWVAMDMFSKKPAVIWNADGKGSVRRVRWEQYEGQDTATTDDDKYGLVESREIGGVDEKTNSIKYVSYWNIQYDSEGNVVYRDFESGTTGLVSRSTRGAEFTLTIDGNRVMVTMLGVNGMEVRDLLTAALVDGKVNNYVIADVSGDLYLNISRLTGLTAAELKGLGINVDNTGKINIGRMGGDSIMLALMGFFFNSLKIEATVIFKNYILETKSAIETSGTIKQSMGVSIVAKDGSRISSGNFYNASGNFSGATLNTFIMIGDTVLAKLGTFGSRSAGLAFAKAAEAFLGRNPSMSISLAATFIRSDGRLNGIYGVERAANGEITPIAQIAIYDKQGNYLLTQNMFTRGADGAYSFNARGMSALEHKVSTMNNLASETGARNLALWIGSKFGTVFKESFLATIYNAAGEHVFTAGVGKDQGNRNIMMIEDIKSGRGSISYYDNVQNKYTTSTYDTARNAATDGQVKLATARTGDTAITRGIATT
ncbi:MAG: hypothetical protein Q8R13_02745, partial [bacterium]|nr:hypothetical protein [bacterium]